MWNSAMSRAPTNEKMKMKFRDIKAVLFDMDGTLVDSEIYTFRCIDQLLTELDIPHEGFDSLELPGLTWGKIEQVLWDAFPLLQGVELMAQLRERFHQVFIDEPLPFIPGAPEALRAACQHHSVAIVTSSNSEVVQHLVEGMQIGELLRLIVSADDVSRSKPDPQCFQIAARGLEIEPHHCLVFEDSVAGLQAARRAGMGTVAVGGGGTADMGINDYTELPERFFELIGQEAPLG